MKIKELLTREQALELFNSFIKQSKVGFREDVDFVISITGIDIFTPEVMAEIEEEIPNLKKVLESKENGTELELFEEELSEFSENVMMQAQVMNKAMLYHLTADEIKQLLDWTIEVDGLTYIKEKIAK